MDENVKNAGAEPGAAIQEEKKEAPAETPGEAVPADQLAADAAESTDGHKEDVLVPEETGKDKLEPDTLVLAFSTKFLHFVIGRAIFAPRDDGQEVDPEFRNVDEIEVIEDCLYAGEQYTKVAPGLQVAQPVCAFMRVPQYVLFGKFSRNIYSLKADKNEFIDVHFVDNCRDRDAIGLKRAYYTLTRINTYEAFQRFEEEQAARRMLMSGKMPMKMPGKAPGKPAPGGKSPLVGMPTS